MPSRTASLVRRSARVTLGLDALERVASSGAAFDPEVVRKLLIHTTHTDPLSTLIPREREVLEKMAQGHTNAGIASALYVSLSAVEKHANAIFDKAWPAQRSRLQPQDARRAALSRLVEPGRHQPCRPGS